MPTAVYTLEKVAKFLRRVPAEDERMISAHIRALGEGRREELFIKRLRGGIREIVARDYRIIFFGIGSTNMKIGKYEFIDFNELLAERLKDKAFRDGFNEELSRLRLAHEVKTLRARMKLTQRQVARKAGMPQSVVARIESGEHGISVATLGRLAQVFGKRVGIV